MDRASHEHLATANAPIRSVQRALALLRALNEREVWTLQSLQVRTGLPKSTLHRLLSTLQAEHYVYSGQEMYGKYRLTQDVGNLSCGITQKHRLADVARPIVISATKACKWPMAVGVIEGASIRANVCTMPYSPYSMRPTCIGQHFDPLSTALGNAYLAYCDAVERRILIELLDQAEASKRRWTPVALHRLIRTVRTRGYGLRAGHRTDESSAIAVPIYWPDGQLAGVLGCSTFSRTLAPSWLERIVPQVQNAAEEIRRSLAA